MISEMDNSVMLAAQIKKASWVGVNEVPVDSDLLSLQPLKVSKDNFQSYMKSYLETVDSTIKNSFGDMERCQA